MFQADDWMVNVAGYENTDAIESLASSPGLDSFEESLVMSDSDRLTLFRISKLFVPFDTHAPGEPATSGA